MANCDKFVSLYTEYLDGKLSPEIKSEFDQHIHTCQECAESLKHMRALKSQLRGLTPIKTSDAFHIVLRSRIRQELEKETIPEKIINFFRIYRWPSFATGVAVLILITLFSYSTIFQPQINNQITSQPIKTLEPSVKTPTHVVTPSPGVFLVVEQAEKEKIFKRGEMIDSETLQQYRQNLNVYFDSTRVFQPKPVGVYFTAPSTSAAF